MFPPFFLDDLENVLLEPGPTWLGLTRLALSASPRLDFLLWIFGAFFIFRRSKLLVWFLLGAQGRVECRHLIFPLFNLFGAHFFLVCSPGLYLNQSVARADPLGKLRFTFGALLSPTLASSPPNSGFFFPYPTSLCPF